MPFRASLSAVVLAGLAGAAAAQPITAPPEDLIPGHPVVHCYINLATGERVVSRGPATRVDPAVFRNDDWSCSGWWFWNIDNPGRDPALGREPFGSAVVHWADIAGPAFVTGMEFTYTTNASFGSPEHPQPIPGFNIRATLLANYEGGLDPGGTLATPVASVLVEDLWGKELWSSEFEQCGLLGFCGAALYIDLEGSGQEFTLGDPASGALDLDADGLHDFGVAFSFEQPATLHATAGVSLVRPASLGGAGTATTAPDRSEWFNQKAGPLTDYVGSYWFGGGDCVSRPYASLYLNLYGPSATGCEVIDYNTDGLIDFADYLAFLAWYDTGDRRVDLNGDGVTDFADYLEFLNLYDACG